MLNTHTLIIRINERENCSLGVERKLAVHDGEHFLAQHGEKVFQHFDNVRVARVVILFQVPEQVLEQVRVLFVHHPVRFFEHVVETHLGLVQHVLEVLCRRDAKTRRKNTVRLVNRPRSGRILDLTSSNSVDRNRQ